MPTKKQQQHKNCQKKLGSITTTESSQVLTLSMTLPVVLSTSARNGELLFPLAPETKKHKDQNQKRH
ncbi:MAG: hypothetical protein BRD50_02205 [Bacteroidetes bacterium SW_11_45_7]|nr:MAG: hypothetical protein BRD50_02205 [Bacteroidetes bacterium SW_11_45_7]